MLPDYRRTILDKLADSAGMSDLENRIRFEAHLTPQDIHDRYHVLDGAIYGLASHGRMFGAFKPANRSPDLRGLYLAGGAAHPGPGMPMVLMSGWIAADALHRDWGGQQSEIEVARSGNRPRLPASSQLATGPVAATCSQLATGPVAATCSPLATGPVAATLADALPRRSAWRIRFSLRCFRRMMRKNFHAFRLSKTGKPPALNGRPVVVVLNHPSWWDPILGVVLAEWFEPYQHFVPIAAEALKQYRIFEPMGFFGVEAGTPAGALAFLRTASGILSRPSRALWITAQGKFTDPRERPVRLRQGVGHLIRRLEDVVVLPLAIEYPFWQERYPEALAHFGQPIFVGRGREHSVAAWMERIEAGLTSAQDELACLAKEQDPTRFETLIGGNVGVGGIYDLWRRFKAMFAASDSMAPTRRLDRYPHRQEKARERRDAGVCLAAAGGSAGLALRREPVRLSPGIPTVVGSSADSFRADPRAKRRAIDHGRGRGSAGQSRRVD